MSNHVVSGLIKRRRELSGDMLELLAQADALARDLEALDRTLRMFAPELTPEAIPARRSKPQPDWAIRGEVVRIILSALRQADAPLSTAALAIEVHQRRGLSGEVTRLHLKRVRKCLDRQSVKGAVWRVSIGGVICWRLG